MILKILQKLLVIVPRLIFLCVQSSKNFKSFTFEIVHKMIWNKITNGSFGHDRIHCKIFFFIRSFSESKSNIPIIVKMHKIFEEKYLSFRTYHDHSKDIVRIRSYIIIEFLYQIIFHSFFKEDLHLLFIC